MPRIEFARWALLLDPRENYEGGTPALVVAPTGDTATFVCATDTGYCDETPIPRAVLTWLEKQETVVEAFLEEIGR